MSDLAKIEPIYKQIEELDKGRSLMLKNMYEPMISYYTDQEKEVESLTSQEPTREVYDFCYSMRQDLKNKRVDFVKSTKEEAARVALISKAFKAAGDNVAFLSGPLENRLLAKELEYKEILEKERAAAHEKRAEQLKRLGAELIPPNLDKLSLSDFSDLLDITAKEIEEKKEIERKRLEEEQARKAEEARIKAEQEAERLRLELENKELREAEERRLQEVRDKEEENKALKAKLDLLEKAENDRLEAENKKIEEEKAKVAKEKAELLAAFEKAEKEKEALRLKEEAEKKSEALKPDKEKLLKYIDSLDYESIKLNSKEAVFAQDQIMMLFVDFVNMSKAIVESEL